jgi:hypothetical protein
VEKNSANSRNCFGFGQKIWWQQRGFTFVRKYVECNRIVCFGTIYGQ